MIAPALVLTVIVVIFCRVFGIQRTPTWHHCRARCSYFNFFVKSHEMPADTFVCCQTSCPRKP